MKKNPVPVVFAALGLVLFVIGFVCALQKEKPVAFILMAIIGFIIMLIGAISSGIQNQGKRCQKRSEDLSEQIKENMKKARQAERELRRREENQP